MKPYSLGRPNRMELAVLIAVAVLLLWGVANLERLVNRRADQHERRLSDVAESLEKVVERVSELREQLMTPHQKEKRKYDRATRVGISDVRQWHEGQILRLVSCSYYYPSDEAVIDFFEYKHERIGEATRWGFTVEGFSRSAASDEWQRCSFLAAENECSTSSCSGTIRCV